MASQYFVPMKRRGDDIITSDDVVGTSPSGQCGKRCQAGSEASATLANVQSDQEWVTPTYGDNEMAR